MKKTFPALFLFYLLLISGQAVLAQRASSWKPRQIVGSAQFSLAELDTIVLRTSPSAALKAALQDLNDLLQKRYGTELEFVSAGHPKNALYFQRVDDGAVGGAFTIERSRTRITIRSADPDGWCNALYAIMETMLGARWYWSGEMGFEWVEASRDFFPSQPWRERPAFVQREFYPANTDFARRNRLNKVYSFNHNLAKVFNSDLFESTPEVFAEVNGRRKRPRNNAATDPQPEFTHPDAVEVAAEAALEHFAAHPERKSFSLSINDNVLFDTTERTEKVVTPLQYFRGRPDYTDLVFGFMNRVAERVFDEGGAWQTPAGEERYLTALSYYWTEQAPNIPIHPRVMPVLTSDRAQWHDAAYRAEDKALIAQWAASGAERVATWDYYFGAPYPYPRQLNQWIAESLRYLSESGVDVFFSQLPSFWGLDGAKAWLGAKLLWDPQQDAEALLDEYYTAFFGRASQPMRAFYETAERFRNENEGQADWIKLYKDESSIALFTPEVLEQMRGYLEQAKRELADTHVEGSGSDQPSREAGDSADLNSARFRQRVAVVSRAFRFTELYASFDQARRALVVACLDLREVAQIETRLRVYQKAKRAYQTYLDAYVADAAYAPARRRIALEQSDPVGLAQGLLQAEAHEFISLTQDPTLTHQGHASRNFLGPVLPQLQGWHLDYRPSQHFKVVASEGSENTDAGLRISGADMVSIFRTLPVVSNTAYELRLQGNWHTSLDNRVYIHIAWLDRNGERLRAEVPLRLPSEDRSEVATIRLPFEAPNNAYDIRLRIVVSRQYPDDFLDLRRLDFGVVR